MPWGSGDSFWDKKTTNGTFLQFDILHIVGKLLKKYNNIFWCENSNIIILKKIEKLIR